MSENQQYNSNTVQYTHSVKIETTAKGLAQVSIHVYSNSGEEIKFEAVRLYQNIIADLRTKGVKVAGE